MGLALPGRRFARITDWSKFIGTHSLAALPRVVAKQRLFLLRRFFFF